VSDIESDNNEDPDIINSSDISNYWRVEKFRRDLLGAIYCEQQIACDLSYLLRQR
jgi:hypothetical protein